MNSELQNAFENAPVPQGSPESAPMDVWEPPFERWMRIADSSLSNVPVSYYSVGPRPQTFSAVHRG